MNDTYGLTRCFVKYFYLLIEPSSEGRYYRYKTKTNKFTAKGNTPNLILKKNTKKVVCNSRTDVAYHEPL